MTNPLNPHSINRILPNELESLRKGEPDTIRRYLIDGDFDFDIRNALISLDWETDDEILNGMESDRKFDMLRCLITLRSMRTADLARLRLEYSLCPIHAIDFAICFDDEPEDCAQIRSIFPDEHDT